MNTTKKPNYTLPIIVMFFLFAMISFVTGFQNPFGVILKAQLGLSNFQSQLGAAANFIAYAIMGIPAGLMLQKKGYKFSAIAAVFVGIVGVAIMFASSYVEGNAIFTVYIIGALVAGFSMCMLNTVVNPMLNTLGGGGKKGNQLIQLGGSCNSLAATICPIFVGILMGNVTAETSLIDARPALYVAGGIFAFALIVLALSKLPEPILDVIKEEEKFESKKQAVPTLGGALKFPHFVMGIIAIFLYVGLEVGIPQIANLYMTDTVANGGLEMNAAIAGSLVGMYWFMMLIGRLVGSAVGGKVSSKAMLTTVGTVIIVLLVTAIFVPKTTTVGVPGISSGESISFALYEAPLSILLFVLAGLCTSVMWGGIFNLAVEGLGKYTAVASGLFMVMVCGGGIVNAIQAAVADSLGYVSSYWVPVLCAAYILFFALVGSKVTKRDEEGTELIKEDIEGK